MTTQLIQEKKVTKLSYDDSQNVIVAYLNGSNIDDIKKDYNTSRKVIQAIVDNKEQRTLVEKKYIETTRAKQIRKVDEIKEKILLTMSNALDDINEMEGGRQNYMTEVKTLLSELDRVSRLDRGEATEVTQHTNTNETKDYAAIIKELKDATPEQKKAFLSKQQVIEAKAEVVN